MKIGKIGHVKSIYMYEKAKGYLIDNRGRLFFVDFQNQMYQYMFTFLKDLKGYIRILVYDNELLLFHKRHQKIYAISLSEKVQKWYYYNESSVMTLRDLTIHNGQIYLLMFNKKNDYYYLNHLNLKSEEYKNLLRFPGKDKRLYVITCRGKVNIYDDNYSVQITYDLLHGQSDIRGNLFSLVHFTDNIKNQYFISKDLDVIILNKDEKTLILEQSMVPYRIGVNTILN